MRWLPAAMAAWLIAGCGETGVGDEPSPPGGPGLELSGSLERVHDPAIIHAQSRYYVFTTSHVGEAPGLIHVRISDDLRHWTLSHAVFPELPGWAVERVPETRGIWAPDIVRAGGEYRLYYSISTFGENDSAIGLAVNTTLDPDSPGYEWVDRGPVIDSVPDDDFNAIDPGVLTDSEGRHWMSFGSFWSGIKLVALDPETGLRAAGDGSMHDLARRRERPGAVEAPFLIERDGWFYLFASFDFCCRGAESTYYTVVGRARSATGPYVDRDGRPMMQGGGTVVLHADQDTSGHYVGPGHVAVLQDAAGDYIVHHAYDTATDGTPTLRIRRLTWSSDGWPAAAR